jgi:hypothetical protein
MQFGAAASIGIVVFAVPFIIFGAIVLHHFYVTGSFLLDAGWTAYLITHGGLRLRFPNSLGGISYFVVHISPIFIAVAELRRLLPISDIQFFAVFMGICYALPALAVFWLLRSGFRLRSHFGTAVAAAIAIAFSLNGLALAIARYPHSEILVAGSLILFSAALARRQLAAAGIFLGVALVAREDAGFHLFGILFLLVALNRWYGLPWRAQRAEIWFAAVALLYSVVVVALQRAISTDISTLTATYLGDPPFGELTITTILLRLQFYVTYRAYIIVPAIIACFWAARTRNPYILVGYAAFVPWGVLQLVAKTHVAGTLSAYYAYPYLIGSFWPLVGVLLDRNRRGVVDEASLPVAFFLAMIGASFIGVAQQPGRLDLVASVLSPPSLARQTMTDRGIAEFIRSKPALGTVLADTSIVALSPNEFSETETIPARGPTAPNTIIYFNNGYESETARHLALASGLNRYYQVHGTAIRLLTDRPISMSLPIAALLAPTAKAD